MKQREGLSFFMERTPRDLVAIMCSGSGKTRLALAIAHDALRRELVDAVLVAVPWTHLRIQWAQESDRVGIPTLPEFRGRLLPGFRGGVITYASLASSPAMLERFVKSRRVLGILDDIHYTSEWSVWGNGAERLFAHATHRVLLSAWPFRRDGVALPWLRYDSEQRIIADVALSYREARALAVVRPVVLHAIDGHVSWPGADGKSRSAVLSEVLELDDSAERLRSVLQEQRFVDDVLGRSHEALVGLRRGDRRAGGIVFAMSASHAKMIAARLFQVTGTAPVLVLSEDGDSDAAIERYRSSQELWLVSVRKVAAGIDIPRLRVAAYLTNERSPGAVVRLLGNIMRPIGDDVRASYLFFPADPHLMDVVEGLVGDESPAGVDRDQEKDDYLLEPIAVPQDPWLAKDGVSEAPRNALFEADAALRARHTELVRAVAARYGVKQVEVYRQLKREFHGALQIASVPQLRQRVRYLSRWLNSGSGRSR
ncbi:MAG TPA: hypothetical protein VNF68_05325 [Candidatus Baltobacteraceae bacterium]|nr:hypothetical protein [Candidatus Baltobacteraceae bacterium]